MSAISPADVWIRLATRGDAYKLLLMKIERHSRHSHTRYVLGTHRIVNHRKLFRGQHRLPCEDGTVNFGRRGMFRIEVTFGEQRLVSFFRLRVMEEGFFVRLTCIVRIAQIVRADHAGWYVREFDASAVFRRDGKTAVAQIAGRDSVTIAGMRGNHHRPMVDLAPVRMMVRRKRPVVARKYNAVVLPVVDKAAVAARGIVERPAHPE